MFSHKFIILVGMLPIVWLAFLIAPYVGEGLIGIVKNLDDAMSHPFHIELCEDSLKTVLVFSFSVRVCRLRLPFFAEELPPE